MEASELSLECTICLRQITTTYTKLTCQHMFHPACIMGWLRTREDNCLAATCPVCRSLGIVGVDRLEHRGLLREPDTYEQPDDDAPDQLAPPPRRRTAFNMYVREQMLTPQIGALNSQDKLTAVCEQWRRLSIEERRPYVEMADTHNQSNYS